MQASFNIILIGGNSVRNDFGSHLGCIHISCEEGVGCRYKKSIKIVFR